MLEVDECGNFVYVILFGHCPLGISQQKHAELAHLIGDALQIGDDLLTLVLAGARIDEQTDRLLIANELLELLAVDLVDYVGVHQRLSRAILQ